MTASGSWTEQKQYKHKGINTNAAEPQENFPNEDTATREVQFYTIASHFELKTNISSLWFCDCS